MPKMMWIWVTLLCLIMSGCASGVAEVPDGGDVAPGAQAPPVSGEAACTLDCPVCNDWANVISSCNMQWSPAERTEFLARCSNSARNWSGAFGGQFSTCITMIDCGNLENGDDICFPAALQTLNDGTVDPMVLSSCTSGNTQFCAAAVAAAPPSPGVVPTCLQKWVSCSGDVNNPSGPGFTEGDCMSILGLTGTAQAAVQQCLAQDCLSVGQCMKASGTFDW